MLFKEKGTEKKYSQNSAKEKNPPYFKLLISESRRK